MYFIKTLIKNYPSYKFAQSLASILINNLLSELNTENVMATSRMTLASLGPTPL